VTLCSWTHIFTSVSYTGIRQINELPSVLALNFKSSFSTFNLKDSFTETTKQQHLHTKKTYERAHNYSVTPDSRSTHRPTQCEQMEIQTIITLKWHRSQIALKKIISFVIIYSSSCCSKPEWFVFYRITMELFKLKGPLKQGNSFANLIKQFNNLSTSPQVLYTWHDQSAKRSKAGRGDILKRLYRNEVFWRSESCCGNFPITLVFMQNLTFKKMKWGRCVHGIELVRWHFDTKSKGWTASWTCNKAWNL